MTYYKPKEGNIPIVTQHLFKCCNMDKSVTARSYKKKPAVADDLMETARLESNLVVMDHIIG
jgi:hypothetical protein